MAKRLYEWEVTHKKKMADGQVKEITLKQHGPKPPKGARNVRPLNIQAPADVDIQAVERPQVKKK